MPNDGLGASKYMPMSKTRLIAQALHSNIL